MNIEGIKAGMAEDFYHAQTWAISNSDLKIFGGDSPAHYCAKINGAPEDDSGLTDEERKTRVMGQLSHLAILEPERFGRDKSHYVKPLTYPATKTSQKVKSGEIQVGDPIPWNGNATFCETWETEHTDKPVISEKEERRIIGARNAVLAHPVAGALLTSQGMNEVSVFAKHPATGLTLRMRADRLTEDEEGRPWIVDLKSCPNVDMFVKSARDYFYPQQSVFYTDVLSLAGVDGAAFCFIAFELAPRYGIHAVRIVMMDHETTTAAQARYESELVRLAECRRTDTWPLGNEEIEMITVKRFF